MTRKNTHSTEKIIELYQRFGNKAAVARELGMARSSIVERLQKAGFNDKPLVSGRLGIMPKETRPLPKKGEISRYILTSAQNNTHINESVWNNLLVLAQYYDAEVMVSRYTYNKSRYGQKSVKPGREPTADDKRALWYAPEIEGYVCDSRVELAPGLVWCGEMDMLPTAIDPLSGFETYTGRKSGIFPHAKMSMRSVASTKIGTTKFNYTTGTVTQRNYIQKRTGLKAEFHHTYGALIAEVNSNGDWFVRQLNADNSDVIYDLTVYASKGKIHKNNRVEAINWGDVHVAKLEEDMKELLWADWTGESMMDALNPRYQFLHDLADFETINHHDRGNPHVRFRRHCQVRDKVENEIKDVASVVRLASRKWCKTIVVDSNHDAFLARWLREADYKADQVNALFFLEAQLRMYTAISESQKDFSISEWALRRVDCPEDVVFLRRDESFIICKGSGGGIECGMHGHLGVNGSRGTPKGLVKTGRKANTGHTHSAGIFDGLYVAGVSAAFDHGYNKGPSSWSQSHIVTYPNGKRAIITCWNGKWRA